MSDQGIQVFTRHITELLFQHDKLIIPGLGAFICKSVPARIHPVTYEVQPPRKELSFDPNLQDDDGVLLAYLVKNLPARKEAARKLLAEKVNEFRTALQGGMQTLEGIGTFKMLQHGELEFSQFESSYLLDSAFGLKPVQASPVNRNTAAAKIPDEPVASEPQPKEAIPEAVVKKPEPKPQAPKIIREKKKRDYSLVLFLVPLLSFIGLGIIYQQEFANLGRMLNQGIRSAKTIPQETQEIPRVNIKPNENNIAPTTDVSEAVATDTLPRFFIVAGCFKSEHNANNLVAELLSKGYVPSIQGRTPQGLLRVCYQGFPDSLAADALLKKIIAGENPTAWLLDYQAEKSE